MDENRNGLRQLKPAVVFGHEDESRKRSLVGENQAVPRKVGWSAVEQVRRLSEGIHGGHGRSKATKNTRAPIIGVLGGSSSFGEETGSSWDGVQGEEEDDRGGGEVGAGGLDVPGGGVGNASGGRGGAAGSAGIIANTPGSPLSTGDISVSSVGVGGKSDGGGKKVGVRAMLRERLRFRKKSESTAAGGAVAVGSYPPTKDGETQNCGVGGGRAGMGFDTGASHEGPEEARSDFPYNRGRGLSFSSSSSSSSTSSSVFQTPPAPTLEDAARRIPAAIWSNRRASREDSPDDRHGAGGGGSSGAGAGSTVGGLDHGDGARAGVA